MDDVNARDGIVDMTVCDCVKDDQTSLAVPGKRHTDTVRQGVGVAPARAMAMRRDRTSEQSECM